MFICCNTTPLKILGLMNIVDSNLHVECNKKNSHEFILAILMKTFDGTFFKHANNLLFHILTICVVRSVNEHMVPRELTK